MDGCRAGAERDECRCVFAKIKETIPFDNFEDFDRQRQDDPTFLPDEIRAIAIECAGQVQSEADPEVEPDDG